MTKEVVDQAAISLSGRGWTISRDKTEVVARTSKAAEQAQIIIQARPARGETRVTFICSAAPERFNHAVAKISGDGVPAQEPIEQCRIVRSRSEYIDEDFAGMETEFQEWWSQRNLDETVRKLVTQYSEFGSGPLHHLAALAVCQENETLNLIKSRFEDGDKSGFLPYITVDYVDRAIEIAQKKHSAV
ncbi:hypothetical protein [uncultured Tateyamaria sp.]|uniref:DUF6990 domain-containing protein n=1 Tax=uncultured Tateyamaria sp. TaxID=455651 RepID=UPI0026036855|nr:hypothetical protein [uncultured Tateyamaria sp.]